MSKSLKRVRNALIAADLDPEILHLAEGTETAHAAADAAGCLVDQIAKSIIFLGADSGQTILFITAGGNRVRDELASVVSGELDFSEVWAAAGTPHHIFKIDPGMLLHITGSNLADFT